MVTRKTIGKGNRRKHLLTVVNWEKYQRNGTEKAPETAPERAPENDPLTRKIKNDKNDKNEKNVFLSEKNFSDLFTDWKDHFESRAKTELTPVILKHQSAALFTKSNGDLNTAAAIIRQAIETGNKTFITLQKINSHGQTAKLATADEHANDVIPTN